MSRTLSLPAGCPVVLALIGVCALAFVGQNTSGGALTNAGVLFGPAVQQGQWWRLVSSALLHGGLLHLGLNLFMLYALGGPLERGVGSLRFALVAAGALAGGSLAVMLFDWGQPTLGASGIVMGVAAAFGVALHAQGADPRQHPTFGLVVLNLAIPLLLPGAGISFWGHLGGAVGGVIIAWLVIWRPLRAHRSGGSGATRTSTGVAAVALLVAAAAASAHLGGLI